MPHFATMSGLSHQSDSTTTPLTPSTVSPTYLLPPHTQQTNHQHLRQLSALPDFDIASIEKHYFQLYQSPHPTHHTPPTMSTAARRRLMRDFKRMQTDPPAGVSASPIADNVMTWYESSTNYPSLRRFPTNTQAQERRHHRTLRHTLRRRHLPPRNALRRAVPQQAARRQIHLANVPPQRLRDRGAVSRHPAEPLESDVRCRGYTYQCAELA